MKHERMDSQLSGGLEQKIKIFGIVISLPRKIARVVKEARRQAEAPSTAAAPPHITLITGARSADVDRVEYFVAQAAAEVEPFDLTLYGAASFLPVSQVAFMPVAQGAEEIFELHRVLLETPWLYEEKLDFIPHVTVVKDVPAENITRVVEDFSDKTFNFTVDRINLFEAIGDVWEKRGEYALGQTHQKPFVP